jgi:hypothetical protein
MVLARCRPQWLHRPDDYVPSRWAVPSPELDGLLMPYSAGARSCIGQYLPLCRMTCVSGIGLEGDVINNEKDQQSSRSFVFIICRCMVNPFLDFPLMLFFSGLLFLGVALMAIYFSRQPPASLFYQCFSQWHIHIYINVYKCIYVYMYIY